MQQLPGTSSSHANEQDLALARQFFEGNAPRPGFAPHPKFYMQEYMTRMGDPSLHAHRSPPEQWVINQSPANQAGWAAEFSTAPQASSSIPAGQHPAPSLPACKLALRP